MNDETLSAMKAWLGSFPYSSHPCDTRRFYTFVYLLCQEDTSVYAEDIARYLREYHPGYTEAEAYKFAEKKIREIDMLRDFNSFINSMGNE